MKDKNLPKITFGIIVLNGEPFTRYCLCALYPFAHEIIVIEGACKMAEAIATADGHSTDRTREVLQWFKEEEDPEGKVKIVTRDGFWSEKDEMSKAYAERATGDYLWQVDIDEFYKPEDMQTVLEMLQSNPEITAVSFKQITFWGGFDYIVDGCYLRRGAEIYHRLFKWGPGYIYKKHRPPTVCNAYEGDVRDIKWINVYELNKKNIFLYHYSLVFPKQVREKCEYYLESTKLWGEDRSKARQWVEEVFFKLKKPYRVHNVYKYLSWLDRFSGTHSLQVEKLRKDIKEGKIKIELRPTDDIERLIRSPLYQMGKSYLKLFKT